MTSTSAPGRVELLGVHIHDHDGLVLAMPIPQRAHVELRRRKDNLVRVWSREMGSWAEYTLGAERRRGGWLDFVAGCTYALRATGHVIAGAEVRISSDVPVHAGLASSAALALAVLRAFREAFSLRISDLGLAQIAQRAEHELVGAPGDLSDFVVASVGVPGAALAIDLRTVEMRSIPLPAADLIVVASGVTPPHARDIARARRAELAAAARHLGVSSLEELDERDLPRVAMLPEPLGRRARHVVTELARVRAAVHALERGELAEVGRVFARSDASLRDDFEIASPDLRALVAIAVAEADVHAARPAGDGLGGSIVAFAATGTGPATAKRIANRYLVQTGTVAHVLVAGERR